MSTDFENTPLKDENGKILRYHDGKPILYKHFLNDLPDEDEEVKLTPKEWANQYRRLNLPIPKDILEAEKEAEKGNEVGHTPRDPGVAGDESPRD